ncbi:uncharacterized protein LOC113384870 [Ctenocephalides felis]|uniref:uncharacterized protein LOC113384870 n=1 Tax=Ctenocephalides felis TaxID=7515 RepID=UPI000E6E43CA|nr:uncharacterized protein LOC113384870 [Ctenocephalides felis]
MICLNQIRGSKIILEKLADLTTRGGDHELCTYIGGPNITHTNVNEMDSRLTSSGKDAAFELGQEISKKYKNCLGISSWIKENYWSFGGTAKRHQEEALLIGAGLENNTHLKNRVWSDAELDETKFPKIDYYYRFFDPNKCPEFFKELSSPKLIKEFTALLEKYVQSIQELKKHYDESKYNDPVSNLDQL